MNIYAGNLPHAMTDDRLREVFEAYGTVTSARIIRDRITSNSRGFGFVEMSNDDEAKAAIEGLNGTDVDGRTARVNEARPPERNGGGGGGDRRGGGGGGFRNGGGGGGGGWGR